MCATDQIGFRESNHGLNLTKTLPMTFPRPRTRCFPVAKDRFSSGGPEFQKIGALAAAAVELIGAGPPNSWSGGAMDGGAVGGNAVLAVVAVELVGAVPPIFWSGTCETCGVSYLNLHTHYQSPKTTCRAPVAAPPSGQGTPALPAPPVDSLRHLRRWRPCPWTHEPLTRRPAPAPTFDSLVSGRTNR